MILFVLRNRGSQPGVCLGTQTPSGLIRTNNTGLHLQSFWLCWPALAPTYLYFCFQWSWDPTLKAATAHSPWGRYLSPSISDHRQVISPVSVSSLINRYNNLCPKRVVGWDVIMYVKNLAGCLKHNRCPIYGGCWSYQQITHNANGFCLSLEGTCQALFVMFSRGNSCTPQFNRLHFAFEETKAQRGWSKGPMAKVVELGIRQARPEPTLFPSALCCCGAHSGVLGLTELGP